MLPVEVHNISKSYDGIVGVSGISFGVEKAEIFGLIGPDGSGKTTLLRIINTLLVPDEGSARVMGFNVVKDYRKVRKKIGYMPGRFSLYYDLTVKENLSFYATVFGTTIEENYYLIKDIYNQIEPFEHRLAGRLSGGMKQKLALSCALIHKPDLLVLDEPTTGVDAVSRREFWEMLIRLKEEGITILVSTPYMDEASLCDRVALMQNGRLLKVERPGTIIREFPGRLYRITGDNLYRLHETVEKYPFCRSVHLFGNELHYMDQEDEFDPGSLVEFIEGQSVKNVTIDRIEPGIEDCFMELMIDPTTE